MSSRLLLNKANYTHNKPTLLLLPLIGIDVKHIIKAYVSSTYYDYVFVVTECPQRIDKAVVTFEHENCMINVIKVVGYVRYCNLCLLLGKYSKFSTWAKRVLTKHYTKAHIISQGVNKDAAFKQKLEEMLGMCINDKNELLSKLNDTDYLPIDIEEIIRKTQDIEVREETTLSEYNKVKNLYK